MTIVLTFGPACSEGGKTSPPVTSTALPLPPHSLPTRPQHARHAQENGNPGRTGDKAATVEPGDSQGASTELVRLASSS